MLYEVITIAACGDAGCGRPKMIPLLRSRWRAAASGVLLLPTLAFAQSTEPLPPVVVTATRTPQPLANLVSDVVVIDQESYNFV